MKKNVFTKYSYLWVTFSFFLISLVGHWFFAWQAFIAEQEAHNQPIEANQYFNEVMRDTLENWQSEFLQLIWQVAGLAFLLYVGSPQSKESDERTEAKLDEILKKVDPKNTDDFIKRLENKYPSR